MIYHVSKAGNDYNAGTEHSPFLTIGKAASEASPGDTVIVHEGIYRECVDPHFGGINSTSRITYKAAQGEHPVIKGSEIITDWEKTEGTVYKKVIPNSFFGTFNPYKEILCGDWFEFPKEYNIHTGDVYINGKSMYEAKDFEELVSEKPRTEGVKHDEFPEPHKIKNPTDTLYRWYCESDSENTTIYCNFRDINPENAEIEINVRRCCFFPSKTGINYITAEGFEFAHAACQFAPPTTTQYGMLGTNMSKGWIIRNNIFHDAKCCGISVGNSTNKENMALRFGRKSPHRYQNEAVFDALRNGWSKETVGSHLIENNTIYDCGQAGIVGNLGGVFSTIRHNHIYNIGVKQEFWGYELGGIKLHGAIDVTIENNYIHHCMYRGIWLDWQAQEARVTRNLFHDNIFDFFVEVTHGPLMVDNNLFLSEYSLQNSAQGSAFINNMVAGYSMCTRVLDRATPYHLPHSTLVAGFMNILGGDDRYYGNILLGNGTPDKVMTQGNSIYDKHLTREEYIETLEPGIKPISIYKFTVTPQPVYINDNVYAKNASPYCKEKNYLKTEKIPFELSFENGKVILTTDIPGEVVGFSFEPISAKDLTPPRITEQPFENPDETDMELSRDYFGVSRKGKWCAGAFAELKEGKQRFVVWE